MSQDPRTVELTVGPLGRGSIVLDGRDVSRLVHAVEISAEPGTTTVRLDLLVGVSATLTDVPVELSEQTRDLLVSLGWTPPESAAKPPPDNSWITTEQRRETTA
jgi:hypothetical protein